MGAPLVEAGRDDLMNAVALKFAVSSGSRIIGPAIAGILIAMIREGWCSLVNAVSYFDVIIGLTLMQVRTPQKASSGSVRQQFIEGGKFAWEFRRIRVLLLLVTSVPLASPVITSASPSEITMHSMNRTQRRHGETKPAPSSVMRWGTGA